MCYSAQVWADYRRYVRDFGAKVGIKDFYDIFFRRSNGAKLSIPRGVEASFANPQSDEEARIWDLIRGYRAQEGSLLEAELFTQRRRLVEAERKLTEKTTKGALDNQRIATNKIERARQKMADLNRVEVRKPDSRIFPGSYAPVLIQEGGSLVIKPMRYQCRPARAQVSYDKLYPGTFNARRDNLEGFWRGEFGHTHGIVLAQSFYENVPLHQAQGRDLRSGEAVSSTVIEFIPRPSQDMLVACLWSHWKGSGDEEDLLSFAFITDEPPAEVAAAGHDRCIVPIHQENLMEWLTPDPTNLAAQYAILDARERPFYEHFLLAA